MSYDLIIKCLLCNKYIDRCTNPCTVEEGGCSSNDECAMDLFCDSTNGCPASLGFASGVACCSDAEGSKCNFHQFAIFFLLLTLYLLESKFIRTFFISNSSNFLL